MFDPTVYENLKVVVEGGIYDRDLNGEISITDRQNIVDLATMSRSYSVTFILKAEPNSFNATIKLEAAASDLYHEILEINQPIGCKLLLFFHGPIKEIVETPALIQALLEDKWQNRPIIEQEIYFNWNQNELKEYYLKTQLSFDRKISEDHISDFTEIITLLVESLESLGEMT